MAQPLYNTMLVPHHGTITIQHLRATMLVPLHGTITIHTTLACHYASATSWHKHYTTLACHYASATSWHNHYTTLACHCASATSWHNHYTTLTVSWRVSHLESLQFLPPRSWALLEKPPATQILKILCAPSVHYHVYKSPALVPVLGNIKPSTWTTR
jgi:hypothetical protein